MAEADLPVLPPRTEAAPVRPRRPFWLRALRFLLGTLAVLLLAALVALWAIDTDPGHRFLANRIAAARPASGLRIQIGRIGGSIWSRVELRDLRLSDPQGVFLEAPAVVLDWRPVDRLFNQLNINSLSSDLLVVHRLPKLRQTRQQGPLLPSFDVRIGALQIRRLIVEAPVSGSRRVARIEGRATIRHGRAYLSFAAFAGTSDRVSLLLDAEPARDRFDLDVTARSPAGGVLGALAGTRRPLALDIHGDGSWADWKGRAALVVARRPMVDLTLAARSGRYGLTGSVAPSALLTGKLQRLSAPSVRVAGNASFGNRRLAGNLTLRSAALAIATAGTVDLGRSAFDRVRIDARLLRPPALFPNMTGQNVRLRIDLDGPFRSAGFDYSLTAPRIAFDQTGFEEVRASGRGRWSRAPVIVPLHLTARRVTGVGTVAGGILGGLSVDGRLKVTPKLLTGERLRLNSDKLRGEIALRVDLVSGVYDVALTGSLARYFIPGIGIVDVTSRVSVVPGSGGRGTLVSGRGQAVVRRFDNGFLRSLAGGLPQIDTGLVRTPDGVIHFNGLRLTGPAITLTGNGYRRRDGTFHFEGSGRQARYGPVVMLLDGAIDHPHVELHLARPADALGLAGVDAVLDPIVGGFNWRAAGGSALGAFRGGGRILTPANAPAVVEIASLDVSGTRAQGSLRADPAAFTGRLAVAGGGLSGTLDFAPAGTVQRIEAHLAAAGAQIAGPAALAMRRGRLDATLLLDPAGTSAEGRFVGFGLRRGPLSLARVDASAHMRGGAGELRATLAGSRGRAFVLRTVTTVSPNALSIAAEGTIDRTPVALAAPAVVSFGEVGWRLAPATVRYLGGSATVAASGGTGGTALDLSLAAMPLTVLDLGFPQLGLGGNATGKVSFRSDPGSAPQGRADLTVRGLTRSGLVLSSTPVDLGLSALLDARGAAFRAVAASGGRTIGRAQARLAPLGGGADLAARLAAAPLFGQLRYQGPADVLWRLTGVETVDLAGPVSIAADVRGRIADPVIRGTVRSEAARVESAVTGTVIENARLAGRFDGSRLVIDSFAGKAGDGTVTGRGRFDLAAASGFGFDLAVDADNALLLNAEDIGATVTGPLAIRSSGGVGVISGDVRLNRSRFRLGRAATAVAVPRLAVHEVNRPDDVEEEAGPTPWRLDLKAVARNRLAVSGLGLDSEWRADLAIAGTTDAPKITGRAELIRGGYQFAGRRFDLSRGVIRFLGETPADPALDITAEAGITGLNATIRVTGTGQKPEIAFTSTPSLPEDELLSRLLFGTSISNLSAPEALQLAAAVNSLRTGGGGLDPINAVRRAAGLDRLRILPADATTGQRTTVAAGKYVTRRVYVEVATDGQGYSATRVEWELTRWLSLLSSISTLGRTSANVRISKDY